MFTLRLLNHSIITYVYASDIYIKDPHAPQNLEVTVTIP